MDHSSEKMDHSSEKTSSKKPYPFINLIRHPAASIAFISIFAFLGFGTVFRLVEVSMGVQAITAAFGALFIILSTKFLMEHESDSNHKADKKNEIFKKNVQLYGDAAKSIIGVANKNELQQKDLSELFKNHSDLFLHGSIDAVAASAEFINCCQKIMSEQQSAPTQDEDEDEDSFWTLTTENKAHLWKKAVNFLSCARKGLHLLDDENGKQDQKIEEQKERFNALHDVAEAQVVEIVKAREAINIQEWFNVKKISKSYQEDVSKFIDTLERQLNLKAKFTKTQISFADKDHEKFARVIYLNNVTKKDGEFRLGFSSKPDRKTLEEIVENTNIEALEKKKFEVQVHPYKDEYGININMKYDPLNMNALVEMIKKYKEHFHTKR